MCFIFTVLSSSSSPNSSPRSSRSCRRSFYRTWAKSHRLRSSLRCILNIKWPFKVWETQNNNKIKSGVEQYLILFLLSHGADTPGVVGEVEPYSHTLLPVYHQGGCLQDMVTLQLQGDPLLLITLVLRSSRSCRLMFRNIFRAPSASASLEFSFARWDWRSAISWISLEK